MRICLDVGHGKDTFLRTGAKGIKGICEEYDLNSLMTQSMIDIFSKYNVEIVLSQPFNSDELSLKYRSNFINTHNIDLSISIHHDYNDNNLTHGFTLYHWYSNESTKTLCKIITNSLKTYGINPNGLNVQESMPDSWNNFHMVREPNCPAILIECGFFSNKTDRENSKNSDYRNKFANAVVISIAEFYKLKKKEVVPVKNNNSWKIKLAKKADKEKDWEIGYTEAYRLFLSDPIKYKPLGIFKFFPELVDKLCED